MKKFFQKLLTTVVKKFIKKSVDDVVNNPDMVPDVPEVEPITLPGENSKKAIWKFIIQTLINILAAVLTALGATSCVNHIMQ